MPYGTLPYGMLRVGTCMPRSFRACSSSQAVCRKKESTPTSSRSALVHHMVHYIVHYIVHYMAVPTSSRSALGGQHRIPQCIRQPRALHRAVHGAFRRAFRRALHSAFQREGGSAPW